MDTGTKVCHSPLLHVRLCFSNLTMRLTVWMVHPTQQKMQIGIIFLKFDVSNITDIFDPRYYVECGFALYLNCRREVSSLIDEENCPMKRCRT